MMTSLITAGTRAGRISTRGLSMSSTIGSGMDRKVGGAAVGSVSLGVLGSIVVVVLPTAAVVSLCPVTVLLDPTVETVSDRCNVEADVILDELIDVCIVVSFLYG